MLRRWLILLQVVLVCIAAWELWSVMGCPESEIYCPSCTVSNRQPAGCGWYCIPVNSVGPYNCCCPAVSGGGPGGKVKNCCVATCVYYECWPQVICPPYDLDFTPSHCAGVPHCVTRGSMPIQGYCSNTPP